MEEAKKMKCYKRLIYKQFVQISGLCGPQFLSYLPKHFTHHCGTLYGDTSLRASSPIWASKASLARARERAAKPRGAEAGRSLARSCEARIARPNRRACSQAMGTQYLCTVLVQIYGRRKNIWSSLFL